MADQAAPGLGVQVDAPDRRHGESAGNVARDQAYAGNAHRIDIAQRDVEVPLSRLGQEQAEALGRWFAALGAGRRPEVVVASPYLRARDTAAAIVAAGGGETDLHRTLDERLREREFGVLDRLTASGIRALHPEQAELRAALGKFYHRPPGGESWCDVILRLRGFLDTLGLRHADRRVLVVCHQVVVLCLRYILEEMDETAILGIDGQGEVANCSVTEYRESKPGGPLRLVRYNFTAPLERAGTPVTAEPDRRYAAP